MTKTKTKVDGPRELPPGYVALVERLTELIQQWCGEQPRLPDLRWHDPGDAMYIGGLDSELLRFLANSQDAFRLLEWLDEKTDRKATIFQVTWALRMLGHLPGGPSRGEPVGPVSEGISRLQSFADRTGADTRVPSWPCPHCGKGLDAAHNAEGHAPSAGHLGLCVYCLGFLEYGEGMALRGLSDADLDALPQAEAADAIATLREMRDVMRAAKMGSLKNRGAKA